MSIDEAPKYEPTTAEIDDIFGDGTIKVSRPLWYYIAGAMMRPNSVASEFSEDAELYRKAWMLVILAALFSLVTGYFSERTLLTAGVTDDAEFRQNILLLGYLSLMLFAGYPVLRAVFVYLFRHGVGFPDRRVCAASALMMGCEIFLSPLLQLLVSGLGVSGLYQALFGATSYERATFLPSMLHSVASTWYAFYYTRDAFKVHNGWAFWTVVLAFLVLSLILLAPFLVVEAFFPEWSPWALSPEAEAVLSE